MPDVSNATDSEMMKYKSSTPLFSKFGVIALIIGMVISFFVSQLVGVYIAGKLFLPNADMLSIGTLFYIGSNDGTVVSVSIIIASLLITTVISFVIRSKGGSIKLYLALKPFSIAVSIGMFVLLLLFALGSQAVTYWIEATPLVFVDPLYQSVSSVWLLIFAIVIVAPIYEELVFRGILWSAISEQFRGSRGAIVASVVTSLVFALIHIQYGWYEISTIVLLALLFSYARIRSGSLWLPILLHIINNGIAMWLYISQVS